MNYILCYFSALTTMDSDEVCMILSQKIIIVTNFIKIFVSTRKLFWLCLCSENLKFWLCGAVPNWNSHWNNYCTLTVVCASKIFHLLPKRLKISVAFRCAFHTLRWTHKIYTFYKMHFSCWKLHIEFAYTYEILILKKLTYNLVFPNFIDQIVI